VGGDEYNECHQPMHTYFGMLEREVVLALVEVRPPHVPLLVVRAELEERLVRVHPVRVADGVRDEPARLLARLERERLLVREPLVERAEREHPVPVQQHVVERGAERAERRARRGVRQQRRARDRGVARRAERERAVVEARAGHPRERGGHRVRLVRVRRVQVQLRPLQVAWHVRDLCGRRVSESAEAVDPPHARRCLSLYAANRPANRPPLASSGLRSAAPTNW
jgi:hypothetical protein